LIEYMSLKPAAHFWLGPHAHVVSYSLKAGKQLNIVLLVPDDLPAHVARAKGDTDEMMALFDGWDPLLRRFLKKVDTVDKWRLMHRRSPTSSFYMWA
jgi:salicylate hydroxylase